MDTLQVETNIIHPGLGSGSIEEHEMEDVVRLDIFQRDTSTLHDFDSVKE
jgi:hypothetical protein